MGTNRDSSVQWASAGSFKTGTINRNKKLTTTDATATVIESFPVAVGDVIQISGYLAGGKSDATAALDCNFAGGARRQSAGNVTLVGTPLATVREDSTGAPTVAFNANTTTQELEIKVTGIAAETWNWEGTFFITKC